MNFIYINLHHILGFTMNGLNNLALPVSVPAQNLNFTWQVRCVERLKTCRFHITKRLEEIK